MYNCLNMCNMQKVLPLVYDDSLSYYEQICKLTNTINDIINLIGGDATGILKDYIDKRFDNIMINAIYDEQTETIYFQKGTLN